MNGILSDLRFAVRNLLRTPGFTLMVVLTLTLGIGATTALFNVVRAVVLQPLPYTEPDRLLHIGHLSAERGPVFGAFSPQDFDDLKADSRSLSALAAYMFWPDQSTTNVTFNNGPEQLDTAVVSQDFFSVFAMNPLLGRTFSVNESKPGGDRAVVLSHATWQKFFSADPAVLGRTLSIDGDAYSVIGVMPDNFAFPAARVQIWLPLSFMTEAKVPHLRGVRWLDVVGRMAPGFTADNARSDIDRVLGRLENDYRESNEGWGHSSLVELQEAIVGNARSALLLSFLAAALVLATACVNVASALLARSSARTQEFALRSVLGARRSRMLRHLLLESLLLALAGGLLGVPLALLAIRIFAMSSAGLLPRAMDISVDPWMLAGVALLCVLVSLGCGLLPALRSAAGDLHGALKMSTRSGDDSRSGGRLRTTLVVIQVGLVSMLLYAALLTFTSLSRLAQVDPGMQTADMLSFNIKFEGRRYDVAGAREQTRNAILEQVRALPGVISAAGAKTFPLGETGEHYGFTMTDRPEVAVNPDFGALIVTAGYFQTLGIPFVRGRDLNPAASDARHEIVVNRALAERYWPGKDAVGQRLRFGSGANMTDLEIVGVVGNVRHGKLWQEPQPAVYVSTKEFDRSSFTILVRTQVPASTMFQSLRSAVHSVDAQLPLANMLAMRSALDDVLQRPRLLSVLLAAFAALATCIAAVGIFGVLSYVVGRRRRELAVRMALGARPATMLRAVLGQGLLLGLCGSAIGLAGAVAAAVALRSLLFGVSAIESTALLSVLVGVIGVCAAASYFPARRASRVDPIQALREQ